MAQEACRGTRLVNEQPNGRIFWDERPKWDAEKGIACNAKLELAGT
jgi:hypothetical protein